MDAALVTLAGGGGAGPWWPLFPLLWFALFAGALFFFGARWRRGWARFDPRAAAEGALAERYARGEISIDEYRERLAVLQEGARR